MTFVIIPIDYRLVMGNVSGLQNPVKTLEKLINIGIDGMLISPGIAKITIDLFTSKDTPGRVLTMDLPLASTIPEGSGDTIGHKLIDDIQFVIRYAFDVVKVLLP